MAILGVEGVEDLPGEPWAGCGGECLARCHGAGDVVQGGQGVVEGQWLAVEGEGRVVPPAAWRM